MTRMLASVSSQGEAEVALAGGADIIDLKDPARGALGALPEPRVRTIVDHVRRRRPVSATVGDLPMDPATLVARVRRMAVTGVDYVKVGLTGEPGTEASVEALGRLATGVRLVAVLFADRAPDLGLVARIGAAGFIGVMLDTADKRSGTLPGLVSRRKLQAFLALGRNLGLVTGLAGSLREADVPELLALEPHYLGFRRALCGGSSRVGRLDAAALERVRGMIPAAAPATGTAGARS
jgi:dihydroneopterin aldolase